MGILGRREGGVERMYLQYSCMKFSKTKLPYLMRKIHTEEVWRCRGWVTCAVIIVREWKSWNAIPCSQEPGLGRWWWYEPRELSLRSRGMLSVTWVVCWCPSLMGGLSLAQCGKLTCTPVGEEGPGPAEVTEMQGQDWWRLGIGYKKKRQVSTQCVFMSLKIKFVGILSTVSLQDSLKLSVLEIIFVNYCILILSHCGGLLSECEIKYKLYVKLSCNFSRRWSNGTVVKILYLRRNDNINKHPYDSWDLLLHVLSALASYWCILTGMQRPADCAVAQFWWQDLWL